jgi:hypothetical protein
MLPMCSPAGLASTKQKPAPGFVASTFAKQAALGDGEDLDGEKGNKTRLYPSRDAKSVRGEPRSRKGDVDSDASGGEADDKGWESVSKGEDELADEEDCISGVADHESMRTAIATRKSMDTKKASIPVSGPQLLSRSSTPQTSPLRAYRILKSNTTGPNAKMTSHQAYQEEKKQAHGAGG